MARSLALVPLLLAAFALFDAASAEALSCKQRLVTRGDPMIRVLRLCGEPDSRVERDVVARQTVGARGYRGVVLSTVSATVRVSTWIYDFGPLRLMQELTFEDGILVYIRTLGRGLRASLDEPPDGRATGEPLAVDRRRRRA